MKERYIRTYGNAYDILLMLFHDTCEAHGIWHDNDQIFRYMAQFEEKTTQMSFF